MIYLRAGLFAEGRTDYDFLLRLIPRVLDALGAALFPGACDVGDTIGIDAPEGQRKGSRADRLAAACVAHDGLFEILVIHSDSDGDARAARKHQIEPGIAALHATKLEQPPVAAVACVPVREVEAWMLTDAAVFKKLLGNEAAPALPGDPERERDPKATLQQVLRAGAYRSRLESIHAFFGERVELRALRGLPAFQAFEAELTAAVRTVARAQGHPRGQA